jgi:phosphoglucomutase/phosphomannomutase
MTTAYEDRRRAALAWLATDGARTLTPATIENVRRWLDHPVYADFWSALLDLIEARNVAELTRLFWERLPFGTGGRRGEMADLGSATINRRTIAESAWGLASYVRKTVPLDHPSAVVACDARLRSTEFARVTAAVFAAAGFQVWLYQDPRATPQLSFSVRHLGCLCGVMISASHNPPSDNGFKAYWSHGGQVLPPHDRGIIEQVDAAEEIPLADFDAAVAEGRIRWVGPEVDRAYIDAVACLSKSQARGIKTLYTPLHGVGESSVAAVLQTVGFTDVELYEPQRSLDGRFPNVPDQLPNPERAAVFGPAIDHAEQAGHDLILASDPDADRIAVAVRTREGRYACLTGNQVAALLADYALSGEPHASGYVLTTLVTTPLVTTIARSHGVRVVADLPVGFKHIGDVMERLGAAGLRFGAEESLGYLAGDYCRDKDAAVGALWLMELAATLKPSGRTLISQLHELYRRHGWHRESQVSHTCRGPTGAAEIAAMVRRFRETPPTELGPGRLVQIRDYGRQELRLMPGHQLAGRLEVQAGDLLIADLVADGLTAQVGLRPSGTEPKIKCYFFVQAPPTMPFQHAEERSLRCLKELEAALGEWLEAP